ncbi:MAG TPA: NADP-dependent oxidoreductase [Motilibacteraceae bacterium]|nr:NADP-dependent oxidoreductase [Motilibacteraceae bacterium]
MQAIAIDEFGGPDVMRLRELPDPKLGPDAVLVRVRAAGVNPVDAYIRAGYLEGAFPTHFPLIPGWDVAGVVEQVGPSVTELSVGDEVFGYVRKDHVQNGTYAELVAAPIRTVARKPASLSMAEAAGVPLAGLTALQALRRVGVGAGETVLVHAASGGVGSFAVQIAVALGARVIGTASEGNHDYLRELGAEPVAYGDGLVERVREVAGKVDAAVDFAGADAIAASTELVADPARIASVVDAQAVLAAGGGYVFVRPDRDDLAELAQLADDGKLSVHLSTTLPLAQAPEAHRLIESKHSRGKIVLTV